MSDSMVFRVTRSPFPGGGEAIEATDFDTMVEACFFVADDPSVPMSWQEVRREAMSGRSIAGGRHVWRVAEVDPLDDNAPTSTPTPFRADGPRVGRFDARTGDDCPNGCGALDAGARCATCGYGLPPDDDTCSTCSGDGYLPAYPSAGVDAERCPACDDTDETSQSWHAVADAVPDHVVQFTVYDEASGDRVATVFGSEANVRLVTAAPLLLAAARGLSEAIDAGDDFAEADALRALGRVIYEATGGAS